MRILLTGKTGQVGWELARTLAPLGDIIVLRRNDLNLNDEQAIRKILKESQPDLIVNAAAYTAVDKAEEDTDTAMAVNGFAPQIIAEEALNLGSGLIHYSTDYIFDGTKKQPYTEDDTPNPINIYGKTKLAGEQGVRDTGCPHLILRTSWVYGLRGKNFLKTMQRLLCEREELKVVNDQFGAPTWSRMIAETTALIVAQGAADIKSFISKYSGVYHLSAAGQTTWYEFVEAIREFDPCKEEHVCTSVEPIPTSQFPTLAERPKNSILNNEKLNKTFNIYMPDWKKQLALVFG